MSGAATRRAVSAREKQEPGMRLRTIFTALGAFFVSLLAAVAASAQVTVEGLPTIGKPEPSGTGFRPPRRG